MFEKPDSRLPNFLALPIAPAGYTLPCSNQTLPGGSARRHSHELPTMTPMFVQQGPSPVVSKGTSAPALNSDQTCPARSRAGAVVFYPVLSDSADMRLVCLDCCPTPERD
jgi:hypothetical protein